MRGVVVVAGEAKARLDSQGRQMEEIAAVMEGAEMQTQRTTVDQRDRLMVLLDSITEGITTS